MGQPRTAHRAESWRISRPEGGVLGYYSGGLMITAIFANELPFGLFCD